MKYVFFGSPRFASIVLEGLLRNGMIPAALVANPDRPVGRKKTVTPPLTGQLIAAAAPGVAVLQPEKLDEEFCRALRALQPDLFVVAAYAKIIPQAVLDIPRLGTVGVHPSLLPRYRGSSPIQSAILAGEEETGVTLYHMDAKMDHGPILGGARIPLYSITTSYAALEKKLAGTAGALLAELLPRMMAGTVRPEPQDEAAATYTKKFTREDGEVSAENFAKAKGGDKKMAQAVVRMVNALGAEPGVWTAENGRRLKLLEVKLEKDALAPLIVQEEGGRPKAYRSS